MAVPCSSIRTALLRYGNSSALTTKPARSATSTASLPQRSAKASAGLIGVVAGRERPHDLDQRHHRRRVEEVDAAHLVGALGRHRQLDDRQRRRVGGEDRRRLDDLLELGEQLLLDGEVLDDALDDEVAVGEAAEVVGGADPGEDGVALVVVELALGDLACRGWRSTRGDAAVGAWRVRERTTTSNPARAATSASPAPMIPEPTIPTGDDVSHGRAA